MACPSGHLDDINWHYAVHRHKNNHSPEYYIWSQKSQQLKSIKIQCPQCLKATTMGNIYSLQFRCTEIFPERDSQNNNSGNACAYKMRVVQRQSSSLRNPNVFMILNIPQQETLGQISENVLKSLEQLIDINIDSVDKFNETFTKVYRGALLPEEQYNDIESRYDLKTKSGLCELRAAIKKVINQNPLGSDLETIMQKEFEFLYDICEGKLAWEQNATFRVIHPVESGILKGFKYAGIEQIEMLVIQPSYVRNIRNVNNGNTEPVPVESSFVYDNKRYIPGMINSGDSIFIYATPATMNRIIKLYKNSEYKWQHAESVNINKNWDEYTNSEGFVFLHTISHALIRAISYRTGYSTPALRERVYSTSAGYGILIYSNLPGSDGSTGGLTDLVENGMFDQIFQESLSYINECSNDPFCSGKKWTANEANGAACYSCVMLPETSCEYYNHFLDRNIWMNINE